MMATKRGGRASQRMTQLVLETYGRDCWLKLPGCTRIATTKDHVVPFSHDGEDVLENYRPACRPCNSKRQNRVRPGYGASVVVVIGPPASGKSTYVLEHAKPVDVVIDMDRIARALMPVEPTQSHTYPDYLRHVAISARKGAIRTATRLREPVTVWLIHAVPTLAELAEYRGLGWQVITVDPGRAVVEDRCWAQRPEVMQLHVRRWYSIHGNPAAAPIVEQPASASPADSEPDW